MLRTWDGVLSGDLDRPLSELAAEAYVGRTCFKTGPPALVGVELEWLVHDADRPQTPVPSERVWTALADLIDHPARPVLSSGGSLTTEPGGQLELSSPPAPLASCLQITTADLDRIRGSLARSGLTLAGVGLDPDRPPRRHTAAPRYVAMERDFDRPGRPADDVLHGIGAGLRRRRCRRCRHHRQVACAARARTGAHRPARQLSR